MSYLCFSDFIMQNMPDEKDIYILFKAVCAVRYDKYNNEVSVNIENIEYDADRRKIRFIKNKNGVCKKDIDREIYELIIFLSSRLKYAKKEVYDFVKDIKDAFYNEGIDGIYNIITSYGENINNKKAFFAADLIFVLGVIIANVLYYKMTGITFFK